MVDFLATIDQYLAFVKLCHVLGGLYIWEFFTTLDYEWSVIRGRRPYRRTIWIYSFTRVATLMTVILALVGLNAARPIRCQLWVIFAFGFGYLSYFTALLLIVLRKPGSVAIWNKNKIIIVLTTSMLGVYMVSIIQAISQLHSAWLDGVDTCNMPNRGNDKFSPIMLASVDFALIIIKFLGLLRLHSRGGGMFELGRLLWKQGVIWLLFSTVTGFVSVLFTCLDPNPILANVFSMPALVSMSITATRIYVSLTDFGFSANIAADSDLQRGRPAVSNVKRMPIVHVPPSDIPCRKAPL